MREWIIPFVSKFHRFHSLLLGPPTAFTAHHQESTESENFRLRISFLQIYQELLHWMDLKGMMWPKHRFDMGWIWNEPGTTQWDVRCVRFFFLPACIFLDRKRSMTFWTLHCSSLKVEMHWGWGIYKLDMRYHNVSQIVPIPKETWLWIPKKRHILIPRVEVLFSSIRHLCQALEIGATCVRGQFVSMGFWVTFSFSNSQPFASLNSRLRRWPAFALGRGERFLCGEPFWVPQLLLGISESRLGCGNPGGYAWGWIRLSTPEVPSVASSFCMFCAGINVHQLKMLCSTTMLGFNDPC